MFETVSLTFTQFHYSLEFCKHGAIQIKESVTISLKLYNIYIDNEMFLKSILAYEWNICT